MLVTVIGGKIIYGKDQVAIIGYFANSVAKVKKSSGTTAAQTSAKPSLGKKSRWDAVKDRVLMANITDFVELTPYQFLRFKMAGRQGGQTAAKSYDMDPLTGGTPNVMSIQRVARTATPTLAKWDVAPYGELTGRTGPWGGGSATNRDHLLAHSTNMLRWNGTINDYGVKSESELKRKGLAVVISGKHHRDGSQTYGGRARKVSAAHAADPQAGAEEEIQALLEYKATKAYPSASSSSASGSGMPPPAKKAKLVSGKATLRIEMVGAYFFLYKKLVEETPIVGQDSMDTMLLGYLRTAAKNDDGYWRIDPADIGVTPATSDSSGHSKTKRWKVP